VAIPPILICFLHVLIFVFFSVLRLGMRGSKWRRALKCSIFWLNTDLETVHLDEECDEFRQMDR
jgi:hypothetical protein